MSHTWEELKEEYSNDQYPPFGGPFTDALDVWEWLSKNFDPPKRTEFSGSYMKQTAVEWYYQQTVVEGKTNYSELLLQAKQMEKEQIIDAYQAGDGDAYNLEDTEGWGKLYYNEKYGK